METRYPDILAELQYYTSLFYPGSTGPVASAPTTPNRSATECVQQLDYHGISLLALEQQTLGAEVQTLLGQRKAMTVANDALKRAALIELFNAFAAGGLTRTVLFKGTALAYSVYPHPWLRPRADNDCLIDFNEYDRYQAIFEQLGYQKLFAIEGRQVSYQSTFSKVLAGGSVINIDLHWRISNRQMLANAFSRDELYDNGTAATTLSPAIRIPNKVDSLLIACVHRLGHHHTEERLIWLYDMHCLAGELKMDGWQKLLEKAAAKKLSAITLDALELCCALFSTPVPHEILASLTAQAKASEPSQILLNRDLPEWRYFWQDLLALPGIFDRCSLVYEHVFPTPAYVRQQMQTRTATMGYLKRFWRGLKRVSRSDR